MSIRLSDIKANIRKVTFDYEGNEVNIEYKPSAVTPSLQSKIVKMDKNDSMNMVDAIAVMLVGWDVLGDNGKPIAITTATLGALPIKFVAQITQTVFEDMQPGTPEEKKG